MVDENTDGNLLKTPNTDNPTKNKELLSHTRKRMMLQQSDEVRFEQVWLSTLAKTENQTFENNNCRLDLEKQWYKMKKEAQPANIPLE